MEVMALFSRKNSNMTMNAYGAASEVSHRFSGHQESRSERRALGKN